MNARAWSRLNPSWPVSTTVNDQPDAGVPNCASGSATVIVFVTVEETTAVTDGPLPSPFASTQTGPAKPCTSSRWLHASGCGDR